MDFGAREFLEANISEHKKELRIHRLADDYECRVPGGVNSMAIYSITVPIP